MQVFYGFLNLQIEVVNFILPENNSIYLLQEYAGFYCHSWIYCNCEIESYIFELNCRNNEKFFHKVKTGLTHEAFQYFCFQDVYSLNFYSWFFRDFKYCKLFLVCLSSISRMYLSWTFSAFLIHIFSLKCSVLASSS